MMTQSKNTKRALLASVLSVVLCAAMLIGTTFAWFTDSVTSAGNKITAGNLAVSMEWKEGKKDPADTNDWQDASEKAIFNYDKWEPGYTEARHVRISNNGNLALKYEIKITPTGEVGKLAEVIDVYYIKDGRQITGREDLTEENKIGTLSDVLDNSAVANGHISGRQADIATIALKMRESAGNEYRGQSIGTDFSIQLAATQYTEENDSFGPDYDQDAIYPWDGVTTEPMEPNSNGEYEIATAANLAWLAEEINSGEDFQGKTMKLTRDIDLNHQNWVPINETKSQLAGAVIDGGGHVIRNMNIENGYTVTSGNTKYGSGFIGNLKSSITIKNLTFDNAVVENNNQYNVVGLILGYTYGTTVFENVHVTNSHIDGFGKVGVFLGMGADPGVSVTFRDCTSLNNTVSAAYDAGGLAGNIQRKNGVDNTVIENCTVKNNTFVPYKAASAYKDLKGESAAFTENDLKEGTPADRPLYGKYWYDGKYLWAAWGEYYCSFGSSSYDPKVTVDGRDYAVANSSVCVNSPDDIPGLDEENVEDPFGR